MGQHMLQLRCRLTLKAELTALRVRYQATLPPGPQLLPFLPTGKLLRLRRLMFLVSVRPDCWLKFLKTMFLEVLPTVPPAVTLYKLICLAGVMTLSPGFMTRLIRPGLTPTPSE